MIRKTLRRLKQRTQRLRAYTLSYRQLTYAAGLALILLTALGIACAVVVAQQQNTTPPVPVPIALPSTQPSQRPNRPDGGADQPFTPTTPAAPPAPTAPTAPTPAPPTTHPVARNETLAGIALRYRVPFEQIAAANAVTDVNRITTGQRLLIPPRAPGVEVIEPGATLTGYARRFGLSLGQLAALNPQLTDIDRLRAGGSLRLTGQPS